MEPVGEPVVKDGGMEAIELTPDLATIYEVHFEDGRVVGLVIEDHRSAEVHSVIGAPRASDFDAESRDVIANAMDWIANADRHRGPRPGSRTTDVA